MHHDIKYDTSDRVKADEKAIEDVKFWLGDRFDEVMDTMKRCDGAEPREVYFAMSFAGIQGYPVGAIMRTYMPKTAKLLEAEENKDGRDV